MKIYIAIILGFTLSLNAQIKLGEKLPLFSLKNTSNQEIKISATNTSYLLIDFWASWCAPCRVANKKMVKLYNESSANSLEIIGISLDTDKSKWLKAIEKDKIKYKQFIDPNGFEAMSAVLFGVENLPSTFLFNKEGVLIKINPSEEELLKIIYSK